MTQRIFTAVLAALLLAASGLAKATPQRQWLGEFRLNGQATALILHEPVAIQAGMVEPSSGGPSVDLPALGARGVPVNGFARDAGGLRFQFEGPPGRFVFSGREAAGQVSGTVVQGDASGTFTLVASMPMTQAFGDALAGSYEVAPGRVIEIGWMDELGGPVFLDHGTRRTGPLHALSSTRLVAGPSIGVPYPFEVEAYLQRDAAGAITGLQWREQDLVVEARRIAPHRVEAVTVRNGDVALKGSLMLPTTPGPHPAIVLAHGSGDATRNVGAWNLHFLRLGMAVLSLDKRGAGASTGDWHASSLDDIAGDWLGGVAMLKARTDIDPKRIGVHGSSQGGWTASLMAARSTDIGFVIVRAGSGVTLRDTMLHEVGWAVREAGLDDAAAREAEAASAAMFELSVRGAPWNDFVAVADAHRGKPWFDHAWPMHMSEDGWGRPWVAKNAVYRATDSLRRTRVPVLWFLGDLDHNVPAEASDRALNAALADAKHPDYRIVRLPNTGHAFTATTTGNNRDLASDSHMVAGYWDVMDAWLRARGFAR
ncbi:alpha/beta hydrolase family protein [Thermomonas carbonis]|uniref:Prolyl oligopeptidase family serine peptidase n=1 Tax=Thermomonas carbonis TaxID=1463158 RepID=A0A7G9SPI3_9GAMM|nr:prolyl oligopeptidase family serine peptidase [Thermomonas carbonis]QNN69758.1 prolyl oligopeptidase family serine peptidase [Thermomonas carbonis]GHB95313.1 hypothetical protein GCM10010080_03440 [Thermomonas carbonis]